MATKCLCHVRSSVSSGWKEVARMLPCCTPMMTHVESLDAPSLTFESCSSSSACSRALALSVASTWTPSPTLMITGARMNACRKPSLACSLSIEPASTTGRSALSIWLPKKLRCAVTSRPPISDCPPIFWPVARSDRKMRPAQVPKTGRPLRTNSCSGSTKSSVRATMAMVVDSPPGMTSPSRSSVRCAICRTSDTRTPSWPSALMCSTKAPCSASTPMCGASAAISRPRVGWKLVR
mmetsp:Transcript_40707/g.100582  ORF Transcript_40707/g.100582 Transcript_40707/m.100582 type:complete len:237 (+) Transcript_40707:362-1072(+)